MHLIKELFVNVFCWVIAFLITDFIYDRFIKKLTRRRIDAVQNAEIERLKKELEDTKLELLNARNKIDIGYIK